MTQLTITLAYQHEFCALEKAKGSFDTSAMMEPVLG